MNCTDCTHAEWKLTTAGRLHPSGEGKCTYVFKMPLVPTCRYWVTTPNLEGGSINRKLDLKNPCPCYAVWKRATMSRNREVT